MRLKITDPSGLGVRTSVRIVSEANEYRNTLNTDDEGALIAQRLPYGIYIIEIRQPGFASVQQTINIRSSVPAEYKFQLKVSAVGEVVNVSAPDTLVNPEQAGDVSQVGSDQIQNRITSVPGRSMQDLEAIDDGDIARWTAEHDGYVSLKPPALHRRSVLLDRASRSIDIIDEIEGGGHDIRLAYHLGPQVRVQLNESAQSWTGL